MSAECTEIRELATEVALGMSSGDERARVLDHLSRCPACRAELDELSEVADELLLLAPPREPPVGFETRVLDRVGRRPARRRWLPGLRVAAAALAAGAVTAGVMLAVFADDRKVASDYRESLARVNGRYFEAERLHDATGRTVGQVFGYEGSPSWITVVLGARTRERGYRVEIVTKEGRRSRLRSIRARPRVTSSALILPVTLERVAKLRLLGERPGEVLEAELEEP
jgi:putative zinc finger protein